MKKTIVRVVFGAVLFWCVAVPAFAVLPLLVAEVGYSVVEAFAVRSVARTVVSTVGTAANDASWGSTFLTWMNAGRAVGVVAISTQVGGASGVPAVVEVQMASPVADLSVGENGLKYQVISPDHISPAQSVDGLTHSLTGMQLRDTPQVAAADFISWWNTYASPQYGLTTVNECWYAGGSYPVLCDLGAVNYYMDVGLFERETENKDGVGRVKFSGGLFSADETDPDWLAADVARIKGVSALRFSGLAGGHNAVLDVLSSANNISLKYQEQVSSSTVRSLNMHTDAAIVPVYYDELFGEGAIDDLSADAGGGPAVNFPTDYARAGEAASAANILAPKLDTIASRLDPASFVAPSGYNDPSQAMDERKNALTDIQNIKPDINWIPSLMPGVALACVALPIDISMTTGLMAGIGGQTSIDICDKLDIIRQILGYLFMVGTVVYCFRCFTRGNSTAGG